MPPITASAPWAGARYMCRSVPHMTRRPDLEDHIPDAGRRVGKLELSIAEKDDSFRGSSAASL